MTETKTHVETIIFDRERWSPERAREWLVRNKFRSGKLDETLFGLRFRQRPPGMFDKDSFRTISFGGPEKGIKAVVGHFKGAKR